MSDLGQNPLAPIGVFDSGIGGLSILRALQAELPDEHFVYLSDSAHAPYGERGEAFVTARASAITQQLRDQHGIKALVIACNTATAAAIHNLRATHPDLPFIGVEPALKPAVTLSKTGHIGVMATRGTVNSAKFQALRAQLQAQTQVRFTVQPCDGLAAAIEASVQQWRLEAKSESYVHGDSTVEIRTNLKRQISAMGLFGTKLGEIDTLVLGCTHYALAITPLRALVGNVVQMVDNGPAVARQTRHLLALTQQLAPSGGKHGEAGQTNAGTVQLLATGDSTTLINAAALWL